MNGEMALHMARDGLTKALSCAGTFGFHTFAGDVRLADINEAASKPRRNHLKTGTINVDWVRT
jgi:hypothetical protein